MRPNKQGLSYNQNVAVMDFEDENLVGIIQTRRFKSFFSYRTRHCSAADYIYGIKFNGKGK